MGVRIILAHGDQDFAAETAAALRQYGHNVEVFADPVPALDALDRTEPFALLITNIRFGQGRPHGLSLALIAHHKRPGIRVILLGPPALREHAGEIGTFLPEPVSASDLAAVADRSLHARAALLPMGRGAVVRERVALRYPVPPSPSPRFSSRTAGLMRSARAAVAEAQRIRDHSLLLQAGTSRAGAVFHSWQGRTPTHRRRHSA